MAVLQVQPRRLPAYARAHATAARVGFAPVEGIIVLGSWWLKRCLAWHPHSWHAICPDDCEPDALDWSWCCGFKVLVVSPRMLPEKRAWDRLDALAGEICKAGASEVYGQVYGLPGTYAYTRLGWIEVGE